MYYVALLRQHYQNIRGTSMRVRIDGGPQRAKGVGQGESGCADIHAMDGRDSCEASTEVVEGRRRSSKVLAQSQGPGQHLTSLLRKYMQHERTGHLLEI